MSSVDVVVPCYNYGRFLETCVNSVLSQEGVDARVLIIDDCSKDETPDVARTLVDRDTRVACVRHDVNMGHIATYNEGLLGWASADYSLLLSADDMLTPGALRRATAIMDVDRRIGMCYGMVVALVEGEAAALGQTDSAADYRVIPGLRFLEYCCDTVSNPVQTAAAVVRTEVQQRVGGYLPDLPHAGDMEMWMRFAVSGPIGVTRAVQGLYRQHGQNMSVASFRTASVADSRQRAKAFQVLFENWGPHIPDLGRLRELSSRRLGEQAFWIASEAFDRGDRQGFRDWLTFATDVYPALRRTPMWTRLVAKTVVGTVVWRRLGPLLTRVRRAGPPVSARGAVQDNQTIGWWPEDGRALVGRAS